MIRSEHFRAAGARGDSISVSELLRLHGRATWPALVLVLAVLCTLPLAGIGTALSLLLLALAVRAPRPGGRMFDTSGAALPRRVLDFSLGKIWSGRCLRLFAALYDHASVLLSRRWVAWRHPRTFALWRVWLAVMALLILLPLPFGNVLPGASLVLLGLGWIYKDGVALLMSMITGLLALSYCALSVGVLWSVVQASVGWWARLGS